MIRFLPAALMILLAWPALVAAQNETPTGTSGPGVTLPPATEALPAPFLSASGRFNSLNPPNKAMCENRSVTGRVVSTRVIAVDAPGPPMTCSNYQGYALVNVEPADPADTAKMVTGKYVTIRGTFMSAFEFHGSYRVVFVIAEQAHVFSFDDSSAPARATSSVMICQPPELDALASKLGRELCAQNTLVANLNVTGPALEAAARAPLPGPPSDAASGDPTAIICRMDPEHSDAHLTAIACARNNYWAWWVQKQRCPDICALPAPP